MTNEDGGQTHTRRYVVLEPCDACGMSDKVSQEKTSKRDYTVQDDYRTAGCFRKCACESRVRAHFQQLGMFQGL